MKMLLKIQFSHFSPLFVSSKFMSAISEQEASKRHWWWLLCSYKQAIRFIPPLELSHRSPLLGPLPKTFADHLFDTILYPWLSLFSEPFLPSSRVPSLSTVHLKSCLRAWIPFALFLWLVSNTYALLRIGFPAPTSSLLSALPDDTETLHTTKPHTAKDPQSHCWINQNLLWTLTNFLRKEWVRVWGIVAEWTEIASWLPLSCPMATLAEKVRKC